MVFLMVFFGLWKKWYTTKPGKNPVSPDSQCFIPNAVWIREGKGPRDCLAILTTDINNSFEMKEQTVAAFLDISEAYDNVIIDILCEVM
jgi:hypothetical protein